MDLFKKKVINYHQSCKIGSMLYGPATLARTPRSAGAHDASTGVYNPERTVRAWERPPFPGGPSVEPQVPSTPRQLEERGPVGLTRSSK